MQEKGLGESFSVKFVLLCSLCTLTVVRSYSPFSSVNSHSELAVTSVNPVHNAQVCYFNNVWLMFLIF